MGKEQNQTKERRERFYYFKVFFVLLLAIVLVATVSAQPPFQQTSGNTGIQIESPIIETHRANINFFFDLHAHNLSSGLLLMNDTTNCILHLYTPVDGSHIVKRNMSFDPDGTDFDLEILAGNFTPLGQYSVEFYCEVPGDIGGFLTYAFQITSDGQPFQQFPQQFFIIILSLAFIIVGLAQEKLRMFKHLGAVLMMIMGVITLYPGYSFINYSTLLGKGIGFILIGLGFYFLIEDSFSRNKQEDGFDSQSEKN